MSLTLYTLFDLRLKVVQRAISVVSGHRFLKQI